MDSAYLKEHVGKALALGLAEVCQKKPADPIEYLSKWLRKHVENLKDDANEALESEELTKQREEAEDEKRRQEALLEEQTRIQSQIMKRDMEKIEQQEKDELQKQKIKEEGVAKPNDTPPSPTISEHPVSPVQPEENDQPAPPDTPTSQRSQIVEASAEIENSDTEEQQEEKPTEETKQSPINDVKPSSINTSPVPATSPELNSPVPRDVTNSVASTHGDIDVNDDQLTDSLNIDH